MEDGSKPANTFGSGQQRNHPRPFFYVQPPSQPYFLYQPWQMNNPYSHYGLPGGFSFGRPAVPPYMYMQYPGFVYPHGPVYPVDHRRVFEPRHHSPPWGDAPRRQHSPQPCRETACSEAQTDPSDAVSKLIECLDKIRELDSGVASQASGIFSPAEEKKSSEEGEALPSVADASCLESLSGTDSTSAMAVYDAESSQRSPDPLSWSGGPEEDLPLDSSSVQEECSGQPVEAADPQTGGPAAGPSVLKELLGTAASAPSRPEQPRAEFNDTDPQTQPREAYRDFQILKLPLESLLAPEDPAASHLYSYLSRRGPRERMSVLSPSLDELSSREEIFSTDLDDADIYPKRVSAGRRLLEMVSRCPRTAQEVEEVWLQGPKRYVCACCGRNLAKVACRAKGHKTAWDEGGDSDEDSQYGPDCAQPVRVLVRKHAVPRKSNSVPSRPVTKPAYKRSQHKDPAAPEEGPALKLEASDENPEAAIELQRGTCPDGVRREGPDSGRWGDADVLSRRRQTVQRQEMSTLRKVVYHRPREEEEEEEEPPSPSPLPWDRGSTRRGDSRC